MLSFFWGLPLKEFPQSLRWHRLRGIKPRRRPDFPSWYKLNLMNGGSFERFDKAVDQPLSYVGIDDKILTVESVILRLEVRNEPFNNAYIQDTDFLLGVFYPQEYSSIRGLRTFGSGKAQLPLLASELWPPRMNYSAAAQWFGCVSSQG
ncbi:hypothetical protein F4820DRAFT_78574 [Hypoxylon rubiginosum]|uniref:Uncharacterized protein n=1 Tax=Hypoxylon rubiginosum TaxID=110542 RepID=A0ACB9ZAW8_9PEZI|nr:hypothetical protein F4820DRAFT_78574 [Hypoxylon rubiginosum]